MAEIYTLCRGLIKGIQDTDIKYNHCQRELIVRTFTHFLDDLEKVFHKDATKDECLRRCAKVFSELWRVMTHGEILASEWAKEEWWKSVVVSSVSGSLQMHINILLQEFLRIIDIAKIALAEASCDHVFSLPAVDHSQSFWPIVEEAYKRDTQTLLRDIETIKERRTFLQRKFGSSYGLSKYILRKFKPDTPDSETFRRPYFLDPHFVEISDQCLGRGSFGSVFECKCFGLPAAAKRFSITDEEIIKGVEKEAEVFARLQHANLVQFIGYTVPADGQHVLLTERGSQNLRTYIKHCAAKHKRSAPFSLLAALDIMLQIGEAMKYLHQHNVVHGDLKVSNVLVNAIEKKNVGFWSVQIRLSDFGLLNLKQSNRVTVAKGAGLISALWRAPEVYDVDSNSVESYTKEADVYSFAMTMFEILTGGNPFTNLHSADILPSLLAGWRPTLSVKDHCPAYLSAYIQRCWATNPKDRPPFNEICRMLSYCKGTLLRQSLPSPLNSINEYDARVLSSQLGSKWCVHEGAKGNIPLEVYSYVLFDGCRYEKAAGKIVSGVDWVKEGMKAGRHFGSWTKQSWSAEKASRLFAKAATHDDPEAFWRLGMCYELGMGTEKNEAKAVALYEQARDMKFPSAYVELGYCYATGRGVAMSMEQANSNWASALQEQTEAGVSLLCIKELMQNLSANMPGHTPRAVDAHKSSAARVLELTKFDVGRRLVAGPEFCNALLLQERLRTNQTSNLLKETVEQILENLEKVSGLQDAQLQSFRKPAQVGFEEHRHQQIIRPTPSYSKFIVIALVCLFLAFVVMCLPWRTANYLWMVQQLCDHWACSMS